MEEQKKGASEGEGGERRKGWVGRTTAEAPLSYGGDQEESRGEMDSAGGPDTDGGVAGGDG